MILDQYGSPWKFAHAADRSRTRGAMTATRTGDIGKLIPFQDRSTLASLSARLFVNFGVLRGAVTQKASFSIGEAWEPKYSGEGDLADGKTVERFLKDNFLPACDPRGGVWDWWTMLEMWSIMVDRDGECFIMLAKTDDGRPVLQTIPQHRIRPIDGNTNDGTKEGIGYDAAGRPAFYRLWHGDPETYSDIPAASVIHLFDPTFAEQGRGLPAFTHALEDLRTCMSSIADERKRQEIVSRLHLTVYNQAGGPDLDDPRVMFSGAPDSGEVAIQTIDSGVIYMAANSGDRIEQVTHDNPGQTYESFQDRLIRLALVGVDWSYSLWKPSGQGTAERNEILKCRKSVTRRQRLLEKAARRGMSYAYATYHELGEVPTLDFPGAWRFTRPPRIAIDDGRESQMELDEFLTGTRNLEEILAARGLSEDEFIERRARSVAKRKIIARRVAEEESAASGYAITIDDREMVMLTPNETAQAKPTKPMPDDDDEEEDDNRNEEEGDK